MRSITRRRLISTIGSAAALGVASCSSAAPVRAFRLRTITGGIELDAATDFQHLRETIRKLQSIRGEFESLGYPVQTVRLATQPLARYLPNWHLDSSFEQLVELDRFAQEYGVTLSLGPLVSDDERIPAIGEWAQKLIRATSRINFSVVVASDDLGLHHKSIISAAEIVHALSSGSTKGQENFRFAAIACMPPGTPFFPAAWHTGPDGFTIGVESPNFLSDIFAGNPGISNATSALKIALDAEFGAIERVAEIVSESYGLAYGGLDPSPAPAPWASIGKVIESLSGQPFGSASTLAACAAVTTALQSLDIKTCGYSGLMLPVVEDSVLAARASEGRYGISELLLYSAVCGTGLDAVPLPGNISVESLARIITDVAALALRYSKPLSARLFPIPERNAGEFAEFDHAMLTGSIVLDPG
jgi:uncharacterized protein (UPF0210 family)